MNSNLATTWWDIEHNTDEWDKLRVGKITSSQFKKLLMAKTTKGYNEYVLELAYERKTGIKADSDFRGNYWTERGHELEPLARDEYTANTFNPVSNGGFFIKGVCGSSPDGRVGDVGLLEVKCPKLSTFDAWKQKGKVPGEYEWQIHHQIYTSDRDWCDFIGYYPKLKPIIIRVYKKKDNMAFVEEMLRSAEVDIQAKMKTL